MFRAVVLADGDELTIAEFPQIAAQVEGFDVRIPPAPAAGRRRSGGRRLFGRRPIIETATRTRCRLIDDSGDVRKLEEIEAESIRFALAHYRGQMSQVARKLGIGRSTLYRKMKDSGIGDGLIGDAAA